MKINKRLHQPLFCTLLLALVTLTGCKTGESTESLPDTQSPGTSQYNGPPPATADVQAFKINVWDNLSPANRCGDCHNSNGQSPRFAHEGDVNLAYAQANGVVNLDEPDSSALVTKVADGHNCWLGSDQACADAITSMISSWAGGSSGRVNRIELRAPDELLDPGGTLPFPESSGTFSTTVYPLLTTYCSDCHADGDTRPYLASSNVETAYDSAKSRMSLTAPFSSRLVERLRDDRHNCWNDSCEQSANDMEAEIEALAASVTPADVDPELVTSKALTLGGDGLLANSGGRFEDHVIALYEFKTGEGTTAFDTSGIEPSMHLTLSGNVEWVGGYGLSFGPAFTDSNSVRSGKAQATTGNSRKLHDLLTASGEYSLEAWVVPANVTQEDARIVTYSGSATARNLTLGQTLQNYEILQRSTTTDQNAVFSTEDGANRLQASLQHVVVNFTPDQARQIFINGEPTGDVDPAPGGLLTEWDDNFALVLGNETDGNYPWEGTVRLTAFHNRALSPEQVRTNFEAGVGQKYYLLFGVSHLIDVPRAFIVFEVSQFDSYSYLFTQPFFISLDDDASPGDIELEGMKLGVNGRETLTGQAWTMLETRLNAGEYVAGRGQLLSRQGTVIPLEGGPAADEFFLSFERLGDHRNVMVPGSLPPSPTLPDLPPAPDVGLKTFDAVNASMSRLTGVPVSSTPVRETFNTIRQQLPSSANIEGFLSSQQMAITQLAIGYCDALVEDTGLRTDFFPDVDFNEPAGTAFSGASRDRVMAPLIETMVGRNLASQPRVADLEAELNELMDTLTACAGSCPGDRTETVVKSSCAAVLGSATTLIH
jgi:hypothetical protein